MCIIRSLNYILLHLQYPPSVRSLVTLLLPMVRASLLEIGLVSRNKQWCWTPTTTKILLPSMDSASRQILVGSLCPHQDFHVPVRSSLSGDQWVEHGTFSDRASARTKKITEPSSTVRRGSMCRWLPKWSCVIYWRITMSNWQTKMSSRRSRGDRTSYPAQTSHYLSASVQSGLYRYRSRHVL